MSQVGRNGQGALASTTTLHAEVIDEPATGTAVLDPDAIAEREAIQHEDELPDPGTVWDLVPDGHDIDDLPHTSPSLADVSASPSVETPASIDVGASFDLPGFSYIKDAGDLERVLPELLMSNLLRWLPVLPFNTFDVEL